MKIGLKNLMIEDKTCENLSKLSKQEKENLRILYLTESLKYKSVKKF